MITVQCDVQDLELISSDVYRVFLVPLEPVSFQAGQYLELVIPGLENCFFTLASSPSESLLEVHVQHQGEQSTSSSIIAYLEQHNSIMIRLPMGQCILESLPRETGPLLFIVAGTGFSQAKSIIEDQLAKGCQRPMYLYWGSSTVSGLYMAYLPEQWHQQYHHVHFSAVVSEQNEWVDRQDLLFQAISSDFDDLSNCQAVCCGSPTMVYAILDALTGKGFRANQMISDVFEFAPR